MRPEILYPLFSPVTRIKGVGPAAAQALARVLPPAPGGGTPVVRDLLFHLPTGLIDRRMTYPLHSCPAGVTATLMVTVESHTPPPRRGRKTPYRVLCRNETGDLTLVFFNASEDYIKQALPVGQQRVVSGQTEIFDYRLQMTHPEIIALPPQWEQVRRIEPVYPLTAGLTNRRLSGIIQTALHGAPDVPEWAEAAPFSWREALLRAHAPEGEDDLQPTALPRLRLAQDEILANQLYLALLRGRMQQKPGRVIRPTGALREALRRALPFALTEGQNQAVAEIDADMASGARMVRLLQGDVGSGKTLVALMAALAVAENGAQAAIMAPTEVLARQHAHTLSALCRGLPVRVTLLTAYSKNAAVLEEISAGEAHIVIGTHALFQEGVRFADLALIVIDEQHRFGVSQRMALAAKGDHPHLLHMTATPIPRSLTMTMYGDMECTLLTEKPAARQPIATRVIPLSRADELTQRLQDALARGEKAYWICPQIEDDSPLALGDVAAAESRYTEFSAMFGEKVGLAHGRMKPDAREEAMRRFAGGQTRLLVATTVVEVGVDVPDATIMVIEQADRFGLSQLHQLRGRVGRGDKPSFCVLLYGDKAGEEAIARLAVLRHSEEGFYIAEEDLRQRGGGDLLGTRQSGLPQFRFADLIVHKEWIAQARAEAARIARENPSLEGVRGQALKVLLGLYGYECGV